MVELMSEQKFDEYVLREFKLTNTKVFLILCWIKFFLYRAWIIKETKFIADNLETWIIFEMIKPGSITV